MAAVQETVDKVRSIDVDAYKYGFVTAIESDMAPKGLNEDIVRFISAKKNEPEWLTEWRLDAYRRWTKLDEPKWANVTSSAVSGSAVCASSPARTRIESVTTNARFAPSRSHASFK